MTTVVIPPAAAIQKKLSALTHTELKALSTNSGVPFGTLMHIRSGATANPGIETVRSIYPFITKDDEKGGE